MAEGGESHGKDHGRTGGSDNGTTGFLIGKRRGVYEYR